MLLAIDVGNTNIVLGLMEGKTIHTHWRISTILTRTRDEFWVSIRLLADDAGIDISSIDGVIISSVVPILTHPLEEMCRKYLNCEPLVVDHTLNLDMPILYDNPSEVGADRICNAYGALKEHSSPLIVLDLGTATTFDVISQGSYLGGVIIPGLETSALDLFKRAARLPKVSFEFPEHIIGRTTTASLQSGLMWGAVDQIDGMIERISKELADEKPVTCVATGGLATIIAPHTKKIKYIDKDLTLKGMRRIFDHIKKS